jgi:thymidylate synthase (FAD)
MQDKIDLLNAGFIRLVDHMGSDLSVVRAARVSYAAEWRTGDDESGDKKLLKYLWRNHHTSPFEAATMTFEIAAPIMVFRQWHRHRTQSYNELSARYRELPETFFIPPIADIGVQSAKNKQGRDLKHNEYDRQTDRDVFVRSCEQSFEVYRHLISRQWPRELARCVLPLGTYSHMFATMNLLNAFRFMSLRRDPHAQKEIRVYADAMLTLLTPHYPVCCDAFRQFKFAAQEIEVVHD